MGRTKTANKETARLKEKIKRMKKKEFLLLGMQRRL